MGKTKIDIERCKGCGICAAVCPKKILHLSEKQLNSKGFHPMENVNMDECTGCAACAMMCPDVCIEVER